MKHWKEIFFGIVAVFLLIAGFYLLPASYSGKIVDFDTGEPLEGTAVVATWVEKTAMPDGGETRLKEARKTLTDKNGEWEIRSPRGLGQNYLADMFSYVTGAHSTKPPQFIVYKPGYCPGPDGFGIDACREKMKPRQEANNFGHGETIGLPKMEDSQD